MFCGQCGTELAEQDSFCTSCGRKVTTKKVIPKKEQQPDHSVNNWTDLYQSTKKLLKKNPRKNVVAKNEKEEKDDLIIICNFTPTVLNDYRIGVPKPGKLKEILNTDNSKYEGSGVKNKPLNIENQAFHGKDYSAVITVPPLASVFFSIE